MWWGRGCFSFVVMFFLMVWVSFSYDKLFIFINGLRLVVRWVLFDCNSMCVWVDIFVMLCKIFVLIGVDFVCGWELCDFVFSVKVLVWYLVLVLKLVVRCNISLL